MPSPVPDNVVDKQLYAKIKKHLQKKHREQGKRWGVYSSSQLVRTYKSHGGRYRGKKNTNGGISRWYKENWINVCKLPKIVKCGRKAFSRKMDFPYCRPMYRISRATPKTVKEMNKSQKMKLCSRKIQNT